MKVDNRTSFPVIVVCFVDGRFGQGYLIMPSEAEEVTGLLFLMVPGGEDVYHLVEESFVVTENGRHDPDAGVLLVARGRPSSILREKDGKRYGLRVHHYLD